MKQSVIGELNFFRSARSFYVCSHIGYHGRVARQSSAKASTTVRICLVPLYPEGRFNYHWSGLPLYQHL